MIEPYKLKGINVSFKSGKPGVSGLLFPAYTGDELHGQVARMM
jgi:hypothetical protein